MCRMWALHIAKEYERRAEKYECNIYICVRREVQRWYERATALGRGGGARKCDLEGRRGLAGLPRGIRMQRTCVSE